MTEAKKEKKATKPLGAASHAKNRNKAVRQEALREQLAEQCRVQHIIDNLNKLESLGDNAEALDITRIKAACDVRLKLLNKYLPDLKAIENSFDMDENKGKMTFTWEQ